MANETELTYLVILIALIFVIHLILTYSGSGPRDQKH